MLAVGQTKLEKFSTEELKKYGLFDDVGDIIGVKADAPEEFKEAFEADKKMYDEALARGVQL